MRFSMVLAATWLPLLSGCGLLGSSGRHPSDTMDTGWPPCPVDIPVRVDKVAVVCNEDEWVIQCVIEGWAFPVHQSITSRTAREGYLFPPLQDYYGSAQELEFPGDDIECPSVFELRLVFGEPVDQPYESTNFACEDMEALTFFLSPTPVVEYQESQCAEWGDDPDLHDHWGCQPITPSDSLLW